MALLVGVANTRAASPKSLLQEQQVQFVERIQTDPWRTELHARAERGAEHPGGNHDDDPGLNFYVDDLAVGSLLAVLAPDATAIQRMPAVEDFNFLPDMGRMTQRLRWDAGHGCSWAVKWPASVRPS